MLVLCTFGLCFGHAFGIQNACPRTVTQPFVTVHGHAFWGPEADRVLKWVFLYVYKSQFPVDSLSGFLCGLPFRDGAIRVGFSSVSVLYMFRIDL